MIGFVGNDTADRDRIAAREVVQGPHGTATAVAYDGTVPHHLSIGEY